MNIAQMMNNRGAERTAPENMPIYSVKEKFRSLTDKELNDAVELARRQGISEKQIEEGLKLIRALR